MFWICTDATVNWDAVSAIGTAGAALTALAVWRVDIRQRNAQKRADARLLANLMIPELTEACFHWRVAMKELVLNVDTEERLSPEAAATRYGLMADDPERTRAMFAAHQEGHYFGEISRLADRAAVFESRSIDTLAKMLSTSRAVRYSAAILADAGNRDQVMEALPSYAEEVVAASEAAASALDNITALATSD